MSGTRHRIGALGLVGAALLLLAGCASLPLPPQEIARSGWAAASFAGGPGAIWEHYAFPGKTPTRFAAEQMDGREAVAAHASSSASMLRTKMRVEAADLGKLKFSWKVPQLIAGADPALRDSDDSPVRVMLVFEGDRSRFSAKDAMLSELARSLTGEEMPYATLMYVWCNKREPGAVVMNPRTGRIRSIVLESGAGKLDRWLEYERDVRADFERAFGEPPGALVGVGLMTDTDNTRSLAQAWYGPIRLAPRVHATGP